MRIYMILVNGRKKHATVSAETAWGWYQSAIKIYGKEHVKLKAKEINNDNLCKRARMD